MDILRRERIRLDGIRDLRLDVPATGSPALLVQVYQQTTIPTQTGAFFACHRATAMGPEVEGGAPTISVDTSSTIMVYVLGSKAPAAGDILVARFVTDRWVAERMTAHPPATVTISGCPCTDLPPTLYYHVAQQNPDPGSGSFHAATLQWGAAPPEFLGSTNWVAGQDYFFSTQTFHDPNFGPWRYYFQCGSGFSVYQLTVMFSNYSGQGQVLAGASVKWSVGFPGNSCGPPFALTNASGSDPISRQNVVTYKPQILTTP